MATRYPAQIDSSTTLPTVVNTTAFAPSSVNILRDAIVAIETQLGTVPAGVYSTVKARLDDIQTIINAILAGGGGGGVIIAGDLGGTILDPLVIGLNSASVPAAGSLTIGNVLQVSGSSALSYGAVNLAGGANHVSGVLPAGNQAAQTMGGDTSGTTVSTTVIALRGKGLDTSLASVGSVQDGYALTWVNGDGKWEAKPVPTAETIATANADIGSNKAVFLINGKIQQHAGSTSVPILGFLATGLSSGISGPVVIAGLLSGFSLGAGFACAVGVNSSGTPVRATDSTCASFPNYLGYCDAAGNIFIKPRIAENANFLDFGGVSDGITANDDAHNAMLTVVGQLGKTIDTVYYPAGKYLFNKTIGPYPYDMKIKGDGLSDYETRGGFTVANAPLPGGTTFLCAGTDVGVQLGHAADVNARNSTIFEGIEVLGQNYGQNTDAANFVNTATTVSTSSTGNTYTRSTGSWISEGFVIGDIIWVIGFTNEANTGKHIITNVSATVLTVAETLINESNIINVTVYTHRYNDVGIEVLGDVGVMVRDCRIGGFKNLLSFDGCESCLALNVHFDGIQGNVGLSPGLYPGYPVPDQQADRGTDSAFCYRVGSFHFVSGVSGNKNTLQQSNFNSQGWGFFSTGTCFDNLIRDCAFENGLGFGIFENVVGFRVENCSGEGATVATFKMVGTAYNVVLDNVTGTTNVPLLDIEFTTYGLKVINCYCRSFTVPPIKNAFRMAGGTLIGNLPPLGSGSSVKGQMLDTDVVIAGLVDAVMDADGYVGIGRQPSKKLDVGGEAAAYVYSIRKTVNSGSPTVPDGYAVIINGSTVTLADSTNLTNGQHIFGLATTGGAANSSITIAVGGTFDPSIFNLGDGYTCAVGLNASGQPVRVTDPTCVSTPNYIGHCDGHGTITVAPRRADNFNVLDYGATPDYDAVGNTGTDNYYAFAAAIAAGQLFGVTISGIGNLNGSFDVVVPPGNYLIKSTLQLPRHCSLKGLGNSRTTVLSFDVAASRFASPWGDGILIDQGPENFATYAEIRDLHLVNVTHGTVMQRAENVGSGLEIIGNAYLRITNLTIDGWRVSCTCDAPNGIYFTNCSFSGASLGPYSGYPTLDEGYGEDVGLWLASCGFQATLTTSGAACGTLTSGDTLVMAFDHGAQFTVTFGNSETSTTVAAKINTAAQTAYSNSFVYAAADGYEVQLTTQLFGWSQAQILLVSGTALPKLHFPLRVQVNGSGANYSAITNGQNIVLNIDGKGNFTTTLDMGDTARTVVKKINQAANTAYSDTFTYARMIGLQVVLFSKLTLDGSVDIVSGTALTNLGLTSGTSSNIGGTVNGTGNGHGTEVIANSGLVNDIVCNGCALGGQTNVWDEDGLGHTFNDCISEGGYIARLSGSVGITWNNIQQEGGNHECLFLVDGIVVDFKLQNSILQTFSSGFGTTGGTSVFGFTDVSTAAIQNLTIDNLLVGSTGDNRAIVDALEASPGSNSTFNVLYGFTARNVSSNLNNPVISFESGDSTTFVLGQAGVDRGLIGVGCAKPKAYLDVAPGSTFASPIAAFQVRTSVLDASSPALFVSTDFSKHEHGLGRVNFGGDYLQQGVAEYFTRGESDVGDPDISIEYDKVDNSCYDVEVNVMQHALASASGKRWTLKRFAVINGGTMMMDNSTAEDSSREINTIGAGLVFTDPTIDVDTGTDKIRVKVKASTGGSADAMRWLVHTTIRQRSVF